MESDQIVDLLELMVEDPAWLSEFYSAVANSELVIPMILGHGRVSPNPITATLLHMDKAVFNPRVNRYEARGTDPGCAYYLVYSSLDVYNSAKQFLDANFQCEGQIVDPLVRNGRQIINLFCKEKRCAVINLFAPAIHQYQLSFEQMEIIQRKPVIVRPKAAPAAPEKETAANGSNGSNSDTLNIHDFYSEKIEKLERGIRSLQAHLSDALKEIGELKARVNDYERLVGELESSLEAERDCGVPATVWEAVENAGRRYASRLIIHPRVRDIAEAWPYKKKHLCVTHAVKMLEAVARTLYGMKFESPDGCIDPLEFQRITGYELAMTEGRQTKRNQSLDALRHCRHEDNDVSIYAHLKKRIDKNLHMRIYIGFLEEERKILIGQVGQHMANSQTPTTLRTH